MDARKHHHHLDPAHEIDERTGRARGHTVPVSEDIELYDVDIMNGSTVVRRRSPTFPATCALYGAERRPPISGPYKAR